MLEVQSLNQWTCRDLIIDGIQHNADIDAGKIDASLRYFDMPFVVNEILWPMLVIILVMLVGRFIWRICFFGARR